MSRVELSHKKRKRASGGGRKPAGPLVGKRSTLSMRITPQMRQYLDAEAMASGRSLSQEAELRLMATMGKRLVVHLPKVEMLGEDEK